ncbi:WecB/TagA/CpsF family glycosyltransferase [Clostridium tagluense]|uniref:WecB/TagA/CpsF family glycosyltransferase n=1 Tax=Clostridium TaxID=1485 RepID=UPI0013E93EB9|nr:MULTISPECIES: WecB/TagA/CpsF family glycosyltransferase [Clostridium]MBZ9635298.1 WecB/TagA/CpsF family glycosyltransferase [Clostridium sp. FP1]MCB2311678.1 WecB/TagA/CpsF family glycosyltransferase [Clostridium tagluense]MCB2316402.1 WecB/TagA/CpsF family glycosyltransferase [Clostridium tagluense]MCB2321213.1 WecB/TagA/CpsF family glycosyltransferase [Clostridium tagluense]MCB2326271.1 WecB/TagA/CpsF family glycosyltransferase [Clostridium tagluense]
MITKIFQYEIFNDNMESLLRSINNFEKVHIISGNPEVLSNGLQNNILFDNFTSKNAIIIPDGISTVICSKIVGQPVSEKIAGIELMDSLVKKCESENQGIYLLGATKETVDMCNINLRTKYRKLNILGSHDGYFEIDNCEEILQEIEKVNPKILFVAMGCPRQELFIAKYMDRLPCSVFMGVGGSFDIIAGNLKRAPKWMISIGLEWLYRVAKEPFRIKRLSSIPKFILMVIKDKYKRK